MKGFKFKSHISSFSSSTAISTSSSLELATCKLSLARWHRHDLSQGVILQQENATPHSTCQAQVGADILLEAAPFCYGLWRNTCKDAGFTIMRKCMWLFMNGFCCIGII
jgi:hypothetical protein